MQVNIRRGPTAGVTENIMDFVAEGVYTAAPSVVEEAENELSFVAVERDSSGPPCLYCAVCQAQMTGLKELKLHLLFQHPKKVFCFFCLEKKGWSDEFVKQKVYHEHYERFHKTEATHRRTVIQQSQQAKPAPMKSVRLHPNSCAHCPDLPPFRFLWDRERHLVDKHEYDYCSRCKLIGSQLDVSLHIVEEHASSACYLCRSLSSTYRTQEKLDSHILSSHGISEGKFQCSSCRTFFQLPENIIYHFKQDHGCKSENLRPLKRNIKARFEKGLSEQQLGAYKGVRNDDCRNCHVISVLVLLAHTILPDHLNNSSEDCAEHGSCLLSTFFHKYRSCVYMFHPREFLDSYSVFHVPTFPFHVGALLRLFLDAFIAVHAHNPEGKKVLEEYGVLIEWKYECTACLKFSHVRAKEMVMALRGEIPAPLELLISDYLKCRTCVCGENIVSTPLKAIGGEFVFLEIDRSRRLSDQGELELSLYSLQLPDTLHVLGGTYKMFCIINPDLGLDGHYSTNFLAGNHLLVSIHETNVTVKSVYPGYDQTTLLLVLKRIHPEKPPSNEQECFEASCGARKEASFNEEKAVQGLSAADSHAAAPAATADSPPATHSATADYHAAGPASTAGKEAAAYSSFPAVPTANGSVDTMFQDVGCPSDLDNCTETSCAVTNCTAEETPSIETDNYSLEPVALDSASCPETELRCDSSAAVILGMVGTRPEATPPEEVEKEAYKEFYMNGKRRRSKYLSAESLALLCSTDKDILNKYREKYQQKQSQTQGAGGKQSCSASLKSLGHRVISSAPLKAKSLSHVKRRKHQNVVQRGPKRNAANIDCSSELIDCGETTLNTTSNGGEYICDDLSEYFPVSPAHKYLTESII